VSLDYTVMVTLDQQDCILLNKASGGLANRTPHNVYTVFMYDQGTDVASFEHGQPLCRTQGTQHIPPK
jgi:hypothetical protein